MRFSLMLPSSHRTPLCWHHRRIRKNHLILPLYTYHQYNLYSLFFYLKDKTEHNDAKLLFFYEKFMVINRISIYLQRIIRKTSIKHIFF